MMSFGIIEPSLSSLVGAPLPVTTWPSWGSLLASIGCPTKCSPAEVVWGAPGQRAAVYLGACGRLSPGMSGVLGRRTISNLQWVRLRNNSCHQLPDPEVDLEARGDFVRRSAPAWQRAIRDVLAAHALRALLRVLARAAEGAIFRPARRWRSVCRQRP